MLANGKVFISHAHEDNQRCEPLLTVLTTLGIDHWFDTQQLNAGKMLAANIQRAITERGIFIRICTRAAQQSYWVNLETGAFRGLQAEAFKQGHPNERVLINMIFDTNYVREPFDLATIYIDCVNQPQSAWIAELRRALQAAPIAVAPPRVSPLAPSQQPAAPPPIYPNLPQQAPPILPRSFFTFRYPWIARRLLWVHGLTTLGYIGFTILDIGFAYQQCSDIYQGQCTWYDYSLPDTIILFVRILELGFWIPAIIILMSTFIYSIRMETSLKLWGWLVSTVFLFIIGGIVFFWGLGASIIVIYPEKHFPPTDIVNWSAGLGLIAVLLVTALGIWGFAWFGPTTVRQRVKR